ncbi:MAG TPA: DinB family protein [Blastocatellia bacterium]|nr:DinB family protein [Blastocatellia bacterium]
MPIMLAMLQDLVSHKWYANASLIKAIRGHETAARDAELQRALHHILLANRFWLLLSLELPFAIEAESIIPDSLEAITARYRETHEQEMNWISQVQESDLAGTLESSLIPGHSCSVAQAVMQVCLHSQGHRAQCATRLRLLGGAPPPLDFILWLKERPTPDWE